MKLLLVEDEELLSKSIAKGLKKLGYALDCALDDERALELYEVNSYNLMILDLNLPKMDGMEVLRRIRREDQNFKILILSARNAIYDKIRGLDGGSNDYLTKPFDFDELEARIRNLLRYRFSIADVKLKCGELTVNTAGKSVYYRESLILLTKKEYAIIEYLMFRLDEVVSMEEIIEHVWDSETNLFSNSFRFHIHSLRKKLDASTGSEQYILTIRGQGYKLSAPVEGCI